MISTNMASVLIKTCSTKFLPVGLNYGLCKTTSKHLNASVNQVAFITGKAMRADRPPRPPPFDWRNKDYRMWHVFTDPMDERFDDNSKIVVVEGLPGAGKEKFAQKLADELEMCYMPPETFDDHLINAYGFDYRSLNSKLPIDAQFFDDKMFHADPFGRNSCAIQHTYYVMRLRQYFEALTHVFSTGQGVVLNRCPYSDIVFMKAMVASGYVSRLGMDYYRSALEASLYHIIRPHLIVYLDIPASVSKERIQRYGLPHEVNSKALTPKFLSDIENNYKTIYLPDITKHAHLLSYDWTEEGDIETIVDDIEKLDFSGDNKETEKMIDWDFPTWELRRIMRSRVANTKEQVMLAACPTRFDVPEMNISAEANGIRQQVLEDLKEEQPGIEYSPGFDPILDKGVLWKAVSDSYEEYMRKRKENIQKKQQNL